MLNSGRIVGLTAVNQMLRVQRGEGCSMIYGLVATCKIEKRKVGDAWFQVSPLSVCLSLSLSLSWSSGLQTDCRLPSFDQTPLLRNLSFISFFSSDQIILGFLCFLPRRSRIGWKITFDYFYFLTNFIDISLCADPMRRNLFFHFEESFSTDNIRWMFPWMLVAIVILCVR